MSQMKTLPGIEYNAGAGNIVETIEKMLQVANKENSFVFESLNGTFLVVEPGMSVDEAMNLLRDIRSGKKGAVFYDPINDHSAGEVAQKMEELAQNNDIVVSDVNGTIFRIFKGDKAEDALKALADVRKIKKLRFAAQELQKGEESKAPVDQCLQNQNDDR